MMHLLEKLWTMSSLKHPKPTPVLGHAVGMTVTRPFTQLTITNTLTNQSTRANFVVDTGLWAKHSLVKQEVLDGIGVFPENATGDCVRSIDMGTSCYHLTPFLAVTFRDRRIMTSFNVNARGQALVFSHYDGLLGRNDIARLGIDIHLDKNCCALPDR